MKMLLDLDKLKETLEISIKISQQMSGADDPNFKRIHHHNHHVVLYIKDHIMKESCKNYFEIGTHFGHSVSNIIQSKYPSKIGTCDLFLVGKTIAGDCNIRDVESLAKSNIEKFNKNNYECRVFKGSSHSESIHREVSSYFEDGIDLLFIDGDHRRKAVLSDFEMYFPLVNHGGFIVFDDYLPYKWNEKLRECPIAVNDLLRKYGNQLEVIGLIDDLVACNNVKSNNSSKNSCFIVKKR